MTTINNFHQEEKTESILESMSTYDLTKIIQYQNQRLTDLNYKLGHVENLLERIFRLNILTHSKLKLDVCSYMSAKQGVTNGKKTSKETSKKTNTIKTNNSNKH